MHAGLKISNTFGCYLSLSHSHQLASISALVKYSYADRPTNCTYCTQ